LTTNANTVAIPKTKAAASAPVGISGIVGDAGIWDEFGFSVGFWVGFIVALGVVDGEWLGDVVAAGV
jgi:hypothetical protein